MKQATMEPTNKFHSFKQENQLLPYMDSITDKRNKLNNEFEHKDFFKLMNKSVFGKTMENGKNPMDLKHR